jgi:hypothetical protein
MINVSGSGIVLGQYYYCDCLGYRDSLPQARIRHHRRRRPHIAEGQSGEIGVERLAITLGIAAILGAKCGRSSRRHVADSIT